MHPIRHIGSAICLAALGWGFITVLSAVNGVELVGSRDEAYGLCGNAFLERGQQADNPALAAGKHLFESNCRSCHALDKALTGPWLRGFASRGSWDDRKAFYSWVRNPKEFMKKDSYARDLGAQYMAVMPAFSTLTEPETDAIYDYLDAGPRAIP